MGASNFGSSFAATAAYSPIACAWGRIPSTESVDRVLRISK